MFAFYRKITEDLLSNLLRKATAMKVLYLDSFRENRILQIIYTQTYRSEPRTPLSNEHGSLQEDGY